MGGPKAFQWLDAEGNIVADAKPALSGSHEINGKTYRTSWDILVEHVTPWTIQRAAEFCELPEGKIKEAIDAYIDASPHACFTRGQKVEFSINTSGISQAFTIMMALAGNFDSKGGQNIGREPATGYDSFMFDVVPNQKGRMGQRRKETAMNIKKLSVCQNTGYQDILVADDATGELKTTKQNSGGQVIYGQQGGFGAATTKAMAKGDPFQIYGYWQQTSEPILSIEGGHEIVEGFKNLDFFVNVDLYMTTSSCQPRIPTRSIAWSGRTPATATRPATPTSSASRSTSRSASAATTWTSASNSPSTWAWICTGRTSTSSSTTW